MYHAAQHVGSPRLLKKTLRTAEVLIDAVTAQFRQTLCQPAKLLVSRHLLRDCNASAVIYSPTTFGAHQRYPFAGR